MDISLTKLDNRCEVRPQDVDSPEPSGVAMGLRWRRHPKTLWKAVHGLRGY